MGGIPPIYPINIQRAEAKHDAPCYPPPPGIPGKIGAGALVGKIGVHKEVRSCPDNAASYSSEFWVFHNIDP